MNNLDYQRKKKITIIAIATIITVLGILLAIAFATNSGNEVPASVEGDNLTHVAELPEGYTPITNASELANISSNLSGKYILMDNIDLSGIDFEPIGNSTSPFTGVLDGNNYTIRNMNINSGNQYVGLFGYVKNGTIENLILEDATVISTYSSTSTSNASHIGGVVGYITGTSTSNVATINNTRIMGNSSIKTSEIEEEKRANRVNIGGIAGYAYSNTTITNTYTNVNIRANTTSGVIDAGGLIGYNTGTIAESSATGEVVANTTTGGTDVGGLVGYTTGGKIENSYATGAVEANTTSGVIYTGGLVGRKVGNSVYLYITNAYATGEVTATSAENAQIYASGLIGYSYCAQIKNTYAVGEVVANSTKKTIGGLIGHNQGTTTVTNSYWSPETTGVEISATKSEKALLFQSMLYKSAYGSDWDFTEETGIWKIEEGNTLPYLRELGKPEAVNKTNYSGRYTEYEGAGTAENPFLITNEAQLQAMKNDLSAHYRLENNITLTKNFEPIGNDTTPFTGSLDGNNKTISNLNIESANQYVGLFGYINSGTIKDLTIENATVISTYTDSSTSGYVGAIAGAISGTNTSNKAIIENVKVIGEGKVSTLEPAEGTTVANTVYIGGIVGYVYNYIDITNTSSNAKITANTTSGNIYAGGLVGYLHGNSTIETSYATGNVTANTTNGNIYAGGLAGYNYGTIGKSYAIGNINVITNATSTTNGQINAGGLVGYTTGGKIEKSYATGNVTANTTSGVIYAGGLVAKKDGSNYSYITNAYATGEVTATSAENAQIYASGLIGYSYCAQIKNTYAVGEVVANSTKKTIGGLIGHNQGTTTVTNSYWSPETTGVEISATKSEKALLFQSMLYKSAYGSDWDFTEETGIWKIEEGNTLPYLRELGKPEAVNKTNYSGRYTEYEGAGTAENPFLITNEAQLQAMKNDLSAHYRLENNITLTKNFEPIGNNSTPFTGSLDGNNKTITNLNINSDNQYVGLFGYVKNGTIKDLTIENATVISTYMYNNASSTYAGYVGTIAGATTGTSTSNKAIIENVKVIGESKVSTLEPAEGTTVANTVYIGGIVGYVYNYIDITNTSSNAKITANTTSGNIYAGGLVGYANSNATINTSYATGNVTANTTSGNIYAGGLVGDLYGGNSTIETSYATGNVTANTTSGDIYAGGLAGYNYGTIGKSYAIGNINVITNATSTTNGQINAGGLVGYTTGGKIEKSYATGNVTANTTSGAITAGGLAGYANSNVTINTSYATGNVEAISEKGVVYVGGLIGHTYHNTIQNAYSLGNIKARTEGTTYIGGLVGYSHGYADRSGSYTTYYRVYLTNVYAVGKVEATGEKVSVGGLVGYATVTATTSSYWSPETTKQETSGAGTPKQLQSMLQQETFTDWVFDGENAVWEIEEGRTLPYLKNMDKPTEINNYTHKIYNEGKGTEENPYIITSEVQLQAMKNEPSAHYKLGNSISLSAGNNFEPIGQNEKYAFTGSLDGNNYTITNLNINSDYQYVGLFGYVENATIKDLTLENTTVISTYMQATNSNENQAYIGIIAGYVKGSSTSDVATIENISIIGESKVTMAEIPEETAVANTVYIGGIIGYSYNYTNITNASSNANTTSNTTTGEINAGGLVGYNYGTIEKSTATGAVEANSTKRRNKSRRLSWK